MSLHRIAVSPEAEAELSAACQWYDEQRVGLGDELRLEFRDSLKKIQEDPDFRTIVAKNARRYLIKRFRFHVYFSVYPDVIYIVAFIHAHRHPKVWKTAIRSRS